MFTYVKNKLLVTKIIRKGIFGYFKKLKLLTPILNNKFRLEWYINDCLSVATIYKMFNNEPQ